MVPGSDDVERKPGTIGVRPLISDLFGPILVLHLFSSELSGDRS
jgi:hypothetical protein